MYTGRLLIRFRHPTRDLSFLSSILDFPCDRSWVVGEPRQTPIGKPLPGTCTESYWASKLEFPSKDGFKSKLNLVIDRFVYAKETLNDLKITGGSIEIYLQLSGSINNGDTIDSAILKVMGDLGVDLLIEVFVGV